MDGRGDGKPYEPGLRSRDGSGGYGSRRRLSGSSPSVGRSRGPAFGGDATPKEGLFIQSEASRCSRASRVCLRCITRLELAEVHLKQCSAPRAVQVENRRQKCPGRSAQLPIRRHRRIGDVLERLSEVHVVKFPQGSKATQHCHRIRGWSSEGVSRACGESVGKDRRQTIPAVGLERGLCRDAGLMRAAAEYAPASNVVERPCRVQHQAHVLFLASGGQPDLAFAHPGRPRPPE